MTFGLLLTTLITLYDTAKDGWLLKLFNKDNIKYIASF